MSDQIAQLKLDDIKIVVDKMRNFQPDSVVEKWVKKTLPALNENLEKYNVVSYELNKDSYMGIVLDCTTKDNSRIFIKNVPNFLGRFAHEIGCLTRIPEQARCIIKEYDSKTQCVIMDAINPGDKAHFFENVEGYQKLYDLLSIKKIKIDDEIEQDYDSFTEVLRSDYDKYIDLIKHEAVSNEGQDLAKKYWKKFLDACQTFNNEEKFLLHGDIHRGNALIDENGIKVIDPLGFKAPFVFEFGALIAYEMLDSTPDKYNELMDKFIDFSKKYAPEKDIIISTFAVLIKIYIPTFFEVKDGGKRNSRFLEMIQFMETKYSDYLNF